MVTFCLFGVCTVGNGGGGVRCKNIQNDFTGLVKFENQSVPRNECYVCVKGGSQPEIVICIFK